MKLALIIGIALGILTAPSRAFAYQAFITSGASLLSGPGADYPPVADISGGEPVEVHGCVGGYGWCDVAFQGYRGWFDARLLAYPYQGQRVPLISFGAQIGVPVVSFSVEDYWGRFYRDRPFYRERARWAAKAPPPGPAQPRGVGGPHLPPTPTMQPHPPSHRAERPQAEPQ